ncbi:MAG: 50S ribosomal protein L9 [Rickettsiales bacterium]|jgi:large subunit ribosomal protein L9|nr:50S ribosomal protein L9 [Rickettsiales bacterium]
MKVILKSKIKKLGDIGDVVSVKDGYAKNKLIPDGFALFYTDKNYEYFKSKKEELEKENQEKKESAESLRRAIDNRDLFLIENAGDDGKLYGSINGAKISKYINGLLKGEYLKKNNISLKENIKEIGRYFIVIETHPEVVFEKEIIIARNKEEASKIRKGQKVVEKVEEENKKNVVEVKENDVVADVPKDEESAEKL